MGHVRTCFRVGTRRACRVLTLHRSMYLYRSRRPEQAVLRKRICEIAETRVRFGYRRIHILLRREGWSAGRTRVYRLFSNRPVGSSAFRLSTTVVSTSLAGSCFSSRSASRPFHHGIRRRGGTIYWAALPSD